MFQTELSTHCQTGLFGMCVVAHLEQCTTGVDVQSRDDLKAGAMLFNAVVHPAFAGLEIVLEPEETGIWIEVTVKLGQ